jgi:hypothetical protein
MNPNRAVARAWIRRTGLALTGVVAVILLLAGCSGGGSDKATALRQDNAAPVTITLSLPRTVAFTNRFALASGALTGSLFVRIELGLSFIPGRSWTLKQNGAAAIYEVADFDPSTGQSRNVRFEFRYQGGYFRLTALDDNNIGASNGPFGVDIYPSDVSPVSPELPCEQGFSPCYNGYGFLPWLSWPKRSGESLSLVIPRADPTGLTQETRATPLAIRRIAAPFAQVRSMGSDSPAARGSTMRS